MLGRHVMIVDGMLFRVSISRNAERDTGLELYSFSFTDVKGNEKVFDDESNLYEFMDYTINIKKEVFKYHVLFSVEENAYYVCDCDVYDKAILIASDFDTVENAYKFIRKESELLEGVKIILRLTG